MSTHLEVLKTYKLYIGGAFVRSESGRYLSAQSPTHQHLDNYSHASRKDLRDAVTAARAAFDGWAKRTAYLRGQILSRAAGNAPKPRQRTHRRNHPLHRHPPGQSPRRRPDRHRPPRLLRRLDR